MTSGDLNIDHNEKLKECFREDFWQALERIFRFLATTSRSRVRRGSHYQQPSPHQEGVEHPEAQQGAG